MNPPRHYFTDPLALTLAPPGSSPIVYDMQPRFPACWSNFQLMNSTEFECNDPFDKTYHTKEYGLLEKFQNIASYSQNPNQAVNVVEGGNELDMGELTRTKQPNYNHFSTLSSSRGCKKRKVSYKKRGQGKEEIIPQPYPWARNSPAKICNLEYLLSNGINKITGEVQCKQCNEKYEIVYDLKEKFNEIASYIRRNKSNMHHRAPSQWMNPKLLDCGKCRQKICLKPVISKEREINWLFLLLGEMLGCCKLEELKYLCKHTKNHRTGAKDRLLYLTYLELCKQLDPKGPFGLDD